MDGNFDKQGNASLKLSYLQFLQVPYLVDPNTEVQMFESAEIVEYLQATYAL